MFFDDKPIHTVEYNVSAENVVPKNPMKEIKNKKA